VAAAHNARARLGNILRAGPCAFGPHEVLAGRRDGRRHHSGAAGARYW